MTKSETKKMYRKSGPYLSHFSVQIFLAVVFFCIFLGTATARIEPTAAALSQLDCPGVRVTV